MTYHDLFEWLEHRQLLTDPPEAWHRDWVTASAGHSTRWKSPRSGTDRGYRRPRVTLSPDLCRSPCVRSPDMENVEAAGSSVGGAAHRRDRVFGGVASGHDRDRLVGDPPFDLESERIASALAGVSHS